MSSWNVMYNTVAASWTWVSGSQNSRYATGPFQNGDTLFEGCVILDIDSGCRLRSRFWMILAHKASCSSENVLLDIHGPWNCLQRRESAEVEAKSL